MNRTELYSGRNAADLLNVEFCSNVNSIAKSAKSAMAEILKKTKGMKFNCTKQDVIKALNSK